MPRAIRNMGASVRARLLNIARERNQPFELLLTRYVLERLLYRLSTTAHRDRFVLKGAMLMTAWFDDALRPTRDIDLLGFGDADAGSDARRLPGSLRVSRRTTALIRRGRHCGSISFAKSSSMAGFASRPTRHGRRRARPGRDRHRLRRCDRARGREMELPVLLDLPPPRLRAYPRETVIAEKFQAMVMLAAPTAA